METVLRELTLSDLRDWAGGTILGRARSYVKNVGKLSRTSDDALVAWVSGSERYVTGVRIPRRGEHLHACSCPYNYGGPCKHAVAVVLAAGEALKSGKTIPALDPHSDLARRLGGLMEDDAAADLDEEDENADHGYFNEEEFDADEDDDAGLHEQTTRPAPRRTKPKRIATVLARLDRDGLEALLLELAARYPEVARDILESEQLSHGRIDALERALLAEIHTLSAEPAWYNHRNRIGQQPDYGRLAGKLRALGERGHADALLRLGAELWTRGHAQVEQSDDEGDTALALSACLDIVLEAVPASSLSRPAQLLWIIDRELEDDLDLLASAHEVLQRRVYTKTHWREVAEVLTSRLDPGSGKPGTDSSARYRRKRLLSSLLNACARAGWSARIIPLLEVEVDACLCHVQLVDELLAAGEEERAREWCMRGYASTIAEAPGIARELQNRLRELAHRRKRHDLVAAYAAQEFFRRPSLDGYTELRKAAQRAKCWPAVREATLACLESGKLPAPGAQWPLPATELEPPVAPSRHARDATPDFPLLIEIAIAEKRHDDVVSLYQRLRRSNSWRGEIDTQVAASLAVSHPDIALGIRLALAEELISRTRPDAYEKAAAHLQAMRDILGREHRIAQWEQLLAQLRTQHRNKPRLLQTLDTLSSRRIAG
jgi:uncharacterized Zn finger protein